MKRTLFLTALAAWLFNPVMADVTYDDFGLSFPDHENNVYYDGNGTFYVQSGDGSAHLETKVSLTLDLAKYYNYINGHDYGASYMFKWDSTYDIGFYETPVEVTDSNGQPVINEETNRQVYSPGLTGAYENKGTVICPNANEDPGLSWETLQLYDTDKDGKITLTFSSSSNSNTGVRVFANEELVYEYKALAFNANKQVTGYYINTQYITAITLHTASTLDTESFKEPVNYKIPFESNRTDDTSIGRVTFIGDSITHGVQTLTHRWQLFKTLVDNGIEFEIAGPRPGHDSSAGTIIDSDVQDTSGGSASYADTEFNNVHLAKSSGRSYEIIDDNNTRYGGISTSEMADNYNSNTWICLIGTNDLLSDPPTGSLPEEYAEKMETLLGGTISVSGDGASTKGSLDWEMNWTPGNTDNLGNMGTIASDVMRDATDTMYVLSIPVWCDANGKHGKDEPSFQAVEIYNEMLKTYVDRWNNDTSSATKGNMVYVEVNRGLKDVTKGKFIAPRDFFRLTNADGLHPNEQGNLIMAGNLAQTMKIGGRTAGLERQSSSGWDGISIGVVADGDRILAAENAFTMDKGYTIDFAANFSNGETDGWLTADKALSISLGDGTNSGTLSLSEGYITWKAGDTSQLLFCWDNSTLESQGNLRVAWHNGNAADNVLSGYYVWLGDMLIGQGLDATTGEGLNGILISANGANGTLTGLTWADQAYAPTTEFRYSAENAYYTTQDAASVSGKVNNVVSLISSGKDYSSAATHQTGSYIFGANGGARTIKLQSSDSWIGMTNTANDSGEINVLLTGHSKGTIFGAMNSASGSDLTLEISDTASVGGGHYTDGGVIYRGAIAGSYNGATAKSFHVYLNGGIIGKDVTAGNGDIVGGALTGSGRIGDVKIAVNGSTIYGNVLGGSKSAGTVDHASIIVASGTINGNIIAGGEKGTIGNTSVTITGGTITGDITKGAATRKAGASSSVTVEGNSASIGGNISADRVTLRGVTASDNEHGFDKYAGTIDTTTLTLDNVQVALKAGLSENISSIEVENQSNTSAVMGDTFSLSKLLLSNGTTFSAYKADTAANSATSEYESTLLITTLQVGTGATLNANLVFNNDSVLILNDSLTMGSDVALASGMSLTLSDAMLNELYGMNEVALFTGVDKLTLDGQELADGIRISANSIFSNLDPAWDFNLSFSGRTVSIYAVPEPATATLSLLALAGLAMRRRRRV